MKPPSGSGGDKSHAAVGVFWGQTPEKERLQASAPRTAGDAAVGRQCAATRASTALPRDRSSDNKSLFNASDTLAEVLERVVKRISSEIEALQKRPKAPFDPRHHAAAPKRYYPDSVAQEHKDYFVRERELEALKTKASRARATLSGPNAAAAKKAERPWLSILSKNEEDQVRYKFQTRMLDKGRPFRKAANTKLHWVHNSERRADNRLKRLEHLLYRVQEEQRVDLRREIRLNGCSDERELRTKAWETARDRTEAADMVMRLLDDYKLISATEMGDYLLAGNVFFERQLELPSSLRRKRGSPRRQRPRSRASTAPLHASRDAAGAASQERPQSRAATTLAPLWTQKDAQEALRRRLAESRIGIEAAQNYQSAAEPTEARPRTTASPPSRRKQRSPSRRKRR